MYRWPYDSWNLRNYFKIWLRSYILSANCFPLPPSPFIRATPKSPLSTTLQGLLQWNITWQFSSVCVSRKPILYMRWLGCTFALGKYLKPVRGSFITQRCQTDTAPGSTHFHSLGTKSLHWNFLDKRQTEVFFLSFLDDPGLDFPLRPSVLLVCLYSILDFLCW